METLANEQSWQSNPFFIAGKKAYEIERSLRFNDDDNAHLSIKPSSASNTKTFTISAWVKMGLIPR